MARKKLRKFSEGGDAPIDTSSVKFDVPEGTSGGPVSDSLSFSDAFRMARKSALAGGSKTFTWRGKSYGTQLAGEGASRSTPRAAAASARRPAPAAKAAPAPSAPSRVQQDADRGAAMRRSLTPTSTRVTPEMLARVQRVAGAPRNSNGDVISPEKAARQRRAKAEADARWKAAGAQLKREGYAKGGAVKKGKGLDMKKGKYAEGGVAGDRAKAAAKVEQYNKKLRSKERGAAGFAKGGSVDGCAKKGKTKAMRCGGRA